MGFSDSADTVTLIAKLTPFGRRSLLGGNSTNVITHFSIGDSDANYNAELPLESGEVPVAAGSIGVNNTLGNGVVDSGFRSNVLADRVGGIRKRVEPNSTRITTNESLLGQDTVGYTALTHDIVDRTDIETDSLVNLFHPLGLPITETDKTIFSGVSAEAGGFADTALSGLNQDKILLIGLDADNYGEKLDGKEIKLDIDVSGTGYTLYSTFQRTLTTAARQDGNTKETATETAIIGDNIAFMFSDSIKRPNGDSSKSWSTGFGYVKPFTQGKKEFFNLKANSNSSTVADEAVGVAYLDKGFIAITNPTIVNAFNISTGATATTITYNHTATRVTQNVLCIMQPGEFTTSNNTTFTSSRQNIRISELGLHDTSGNLLAVAKLDKHFVKGANQFAAITVKIEV